MRSLILACSLVALSGCSALPSLPALPVPLPGTTPGAANPVSTLQSFTVTDLQNALDDAKASGDIVASNCYTALIPAVQNVAPGATSPITGAFSAFQKSRDVAEKVSVGIPTGLNIACAPLVLSAQQTVVQLGLISGNAAIVHAALPVVP